MCGYEEYDCDSNSECSGSLECVSGGGSCTSNECGCCSAGNVWDSVNNECVGEPVCGNGVIESGEQCDDGNTEGEDGCSAVCQIEEGWSCGGEPSYCSCDTPDGTSYNCDCDTDDDCSDGLICEQVNGPDACVPAQQCSGILGVIVEGSSGNAISGTNVFLNGAPVGQTDTLGSHDISFEDVGCGEAQQVEIFCSNTEVFCGLQSSTVEGDNDYDSLYFTCDMCLPVNDLYIEPADISFEDRSGEIIVSAIVHTVNIEATNVEVQFTKICGGVHAQESQFISDVSSSQNYEVSYTTDLSGCEKVRVDIDPQGAVEESEEENNGAEEFVIDPVNVLLNIETDYSMVDEKIEDFIGDFSQITNSNNAQLEIFIGRTLAPSSGQDDWDIDDNLIVYQGLKEGLPYNGLIAMTDDGLGGKPRLYVFGNELDGTIAAVRTLIDEKTTYLNENTIHDDIASLYLSEQNIDAIRVYDYLHTDEHQALYRTDTDEFATIIDELLRRQTFNLAIKRVLTSQPDPNEQVVLRMKNINQEMSPAFQNFSNPRPVVLTHGIFSNLFSLQSIGEKIARDEKFEGEHIRDAWLIEYAGGPNTECDECPNYDFNDLIDYHWPALVGGVLQYTGQQQADNVAYSLGGGVSLRSYERYHEGKNNAGYYWDEEQNDWVSFNLEEGFIDHMAVIAPMGAFEGSDSFFNTPVGWCLRENAGEVNFILSLYPDNRVTRNRLASALTLASFPNPICTDMGLLTLAFGALTGGTPSVSYELMEDLNNDVIASDTDPQPTLSDVNELMVVRGSTLGLTSSDIIIPHTDINEIYEGSNADDEKYKARVPWPHYNIPDIPPSYNPLISKFLNDEEFEGFYDGYFILEEE